MNKFTVKGCYYGEKTFPSLNNYIQELSKNPLAGGKMKRKYMDIVIKSIRADLRGFSTSRQVILHYHFYEPNKGQRRDVMNIFSLTDKFVEDALVKLKVIPDDGPRYVVNATHDFYYTNNIPYFEVEIEELEEKK